jgi:uncharacterized protein YcbK (DUF882 family)
MNRRELLGALAGAVLPQAARAQQQPSLDWVELYNTHTRETVRETFRNADGFIPDALAKLDHVLRDHRSGESHQMDPNLFTLLVDVAAAAGAEPRYEIISGYRSPTTNEQLRSAGGGQAKQSQHLEGRAIDVRLKGVPLAKLREVATSLRRGGVGYYERSDFVHLDTARVRYWTG